MSAEANAAFETVPARIVLASRNPGKVREIAAVLGELPLRVVSLAEIDPEAAIAAPAENARSFADNARAKAAHYARAAGGWALADDSGLAVDALGGAPGVRSARYATDECPPGASRDVIDAANNARLLRELEGVDEPERTARFVCHLVLSDGERTLLEAAGVVEGRIGLGPRGSNGFGYDPLFFVPELGCTTAELPPERKNEISHRGQAARKLAALLRQMLQKKDGPPCRT